MHREGYLRQWENLGPIVVRMVRKDGECTHELGDTYYFKDPYVKPAGLCSALLHVLDLYTWRVALGFPSWEEDEENTYRIHCPSKKGTVWEMRRTTVQGYRDQLAPENRGDENVRQP
ncbi:MAG: hypothetical protein ACYSWU_07105 [Planctomycetota bacterium]|jgi:uncharacterized repeat protein (TIGR04076 family)